MIAGCAVQFGGNRSSSDVAANDDQAEFDVYTYMLRTVGTAQYTIVADSTLSRRIPARSTCTQPEQTDCVPASSHAIEAWRDYLRKNEIRRGIPPLFPADLRVTMERDSRVEKTCRVPTVASFSRVGFDHDHSRAILTMLITTGKGPYPGCGGLSIMTVLLERHRGTWRRAAYIESLET